VRTIPIDHGPPRRRIGPFWIEEGLALLAFEAVALAVVVVVYVIAVAHRPA
jgi:hypothetical protein